jgi:hypothetical protein
MSDQDGLYEGSPGGPDHKHPEVAPAEEFIFADEVQALHHIEKCEKSFHHVPATQHHTANGSFTRSRSPVIHA